jgi:hypothetical protein
MEPGEYVGAMRDWMAYVLSHDDEDLWETFGEFLQDLEEIQNNTPNLRSMSDKEILDHTVKQLAKRRTPLYKAIKGKDEEN